ncbi:MAG: ADP-ribosylglycohydrolase family protein [Planctomycetota bacterium]
MSCLLANLRADSRLLVSLLAAASVATATETDRRVYGMLMGAVVGDAVGGPVEFVSAERLGGVLPGYAAKPGVRLEADDFTRLARDLPLLGYADWRPEPEPYAHWSRDAAPGTVTDDTRHKMVLMDALRQATVRHATLRQATHSSTTERDAWPIDCRAVAEAFERFAERPEVRERPGWPALCAAWDRECLLSARWVCGERDPDRALPPERLWGGLGTCCGQMMLPPLAGVYPGDPEAAYLAAYELGFLDNGEAKDINAALVAGLAYAISRERPAATPASQRQAWNDTLDAMIATDPLRYGSVEFMERALTKCIGVARGLADEAAGSPAELYRLIHERCPREHAWEARFLLVECVAIGEFAGGEPLAAMHLALDFGQDTDSAAQLLGAIFGALHGPEVFPREMRRAVNERLKADYGESLVEWTRLVRGARKRAAAGLPVVSGLASAPAE